MVNPVGRLFAVTTEFSGDTAPAALRHHFVAYRAVVRVKVACIRHTGRRHRGGGCRLLSAYGFECRAAYATEYTALSTSASAAMGIAAELAEQRTTTVSHVGRPGVVRICRDECIRLKEYVPEYCQFLVFSHTGTDGRPSSARARSVSS